MNFYSKSADILGDILEILSKQKSGFVMYPSPHGAVFYHEKYDFYYLLTNDELKNETLKGWTAADFANQAIILLKLELI